jgi:hypothetical protein
MESYRILGQITETGKETKKTSGMVKASFSVSREK